MGSMWEFGLSGMFNLAGKKCTATVGLVTRTFTGIPDFATTEEDGEGGSFIREQSVLKVSTEIADFLSQQQRGEIRVDGKTFIYTHITAEGDGSTHVVMIFPKRDG